MPPCQPWIEAEDIAACCNVTLGSLNAEPLQAAADAASEILYELSGRRYPGTCQRTVRPEGRAICWGPWLAQRHEIHRRHRLSRVKLAGHVTAITEVQIDGEILDPSEYRLDQHRYLTRLADTNGNFQHWPRGQRLDLPLGEPGTFAVTYQHGLAPSAAGASAASALACELYRACPAPGDQPGECRLPAGARRIVRQGVTVEIVKALASMLRQGATGIVDVDAFLSLHAKHARPSTIWSPDIERFAQPEGITAGS